MNNLSVMMRILLNSKGSVLLVAAHNMDRKSKDGLCAIYVVITHHWRAHQLHKCAAVCARFTQ